MQATLTKALVIILPSLVCGHQHTHVNTHTPSLSHYQYSSNSITPRQSSLSLSTLSWFSLGHHTSLPPTASLQDALNTPPTSRSLSTTPSAIHTHTHTKHSMLNTRNEQQARWGGPTSGWRTDKKVTLSKGLVAWRPSITQWHDTTDSMTTLTRRLLSKAWPKMHHMNSMSQEWKLQVCL